MSNLESSPNPAVSSPRQNAGGAGPAGVGDSSFLNKFGFNSAGGRTSGKLVKDGKNHVPQYDSKEDEELGIDRSLMEPIKFVNYTNITSKDSVLAINRWLIMSRHYQASKMLPF